MATWRLRKDAPSHVDGIELAVRFVTLVVLPELDDQVHTRALVSAAALRAALAGVRLLLATASCRRVVRAAAEEAGQCPSGPLMAV